MKRLIEGVIKKKAHGGNQLYLSRMHKYVLNSLTIVLNEKKTEREREREIERERERERGITNMED